MYRGIGNYVPTTPCPNTGLAGLGCGCAGVGCYQGLGLFDSGLDWTGWSWPEYLTIAFAGYVVWSLVSDVGRGAKRIRSASRRRKTSRKTLERLRREVG